MKKTYEKPTMSVVKLQHQSHILTGSGVKSLNSGDTGLKLGGGGSVEAHSRGLDDWDDEDDWNE